MGRAVTGRPARRPVYVLGVEPARLEDPGDGGAIAAVTASYVRLVSSHAGPGETRTLADPVFVGQELDLIFETDVGDIVITPASPVNQAGNTTITFQDGGDHLRLVGGRDGAGGMEWRVLCSDFLNGGLS